MPNPSYDVDEILKEVRKRRIENEERVKASNGAAAEPQAEKAEETVAAVITEKAETAADDSKLSLDAEEKAEVIVAQSEAEEKTEIYEAVAETEEQPATGSTAELADAFDAEKKAQAGNENTESAEDAPISRAAASVPPIDSVLDEALTPKDGADVPGEIDILQFAPDNQEKRRKKGKKKKSKKAKIIISIIMALVILIAGTCAGIYIYVNRALDEATDNGGEKTETINEWTGMSVLQEQFDPIYENGRADISTYKNMVKTWYYNGKPASSTHVLNVLLIGEDTREDDIAEDGTRADSAIIASINTDTNKITLTSILRDAYCYYEVKEGDPTTGKYGKINESMSVGGIDCYIRCIENTYKLNIDNYVIVNFNSFEKIIDKLGGVTVELTKAEINEVNNHQKRYGHVTIDAQPGLVQLDGAQALAYCRIRKIDSDNARADRQKTVLLQVFEKMKGASSVKALEVANSLLPYVKTGFSKTEVVDISSYALKHGWLNFQTATQTVPENSTDENGNVITTCKGGTFSGVWLWKVDFPLSAQIMQKEIYGKTNIVLAEKRPNFSEISFSL